METTLYIKCESVKSGGRQVGVVQVGIRDFDTFTDEEAEKQNMTARRSSE